MNEAVHREMLCVGADHPALPGHFPGRPVVPGVVLLDRVAAALERWCGRSVAGFAEVKFLQPLLPGERAELLLEEERAKLRFRIVRAGATIASGSLEARR